MSTDDIISCNICGGTDFGMFANRPKAQCTSCWSLERSRGMMHLIERENLIKPGMRVLHFAPERGIGIKVMEVVGAENYDAYDLFPHLFYGGLNVKPFDLTQPERLPSARYDLILHSHVIEHLPCYIAVVLWHLHRALTPGGRHLFCMPVSRGRHESDFNAISEEDKLRRFGQKDHVRSFGQEDLNLTIGAVLDMNDKTSGLLIDPVIAENHNINPDEIRRTMFMMAKDDLLLSDKRA